MTRYTVFHIARHDVPQPGDLAPEYTGARAEAVIATLFLQYQAHQLDFYRPAFGGPHDFCVWFPSSWGIPGGRRMSLKEYADALYSSVGVCHQSIEGGVAEQLPVED